MGEWAEDEIAAADEHMFERWRAEDRLTKRPECKGKRECRFQEFIEEPCYDWLICMTCGERTPRYDN